MTTEVLRNMIYGHSPALVGLGFVVLDEVHFLQDTYRGPVWEEVIIHLPTPVRLVCLSATVSNAEELAAWITTVRGPTAAIIEERRPVSLENLFMIGDRTSERLHVLPTLIDGRPNPEAHRLDSEAVRGFRGPRRGGARRKLYTPSRLEVLDRLGRGVDAPRHHLRVQPQRLRGGSPVADRRRRPPHDGSRAGPHPRDRRRSRRRARRP